MTEKTLCMDKVGMMRSGFSGREFLDICGNTPARDFDISADELSEGCGNPNSAAEISDAVSIYRNRSKMYEVCISYLMMLNDDSFRSALLESAPYYLMSENGISEAIEAKANLFHTEEIRIVDIDKDKEIRRLQEDNLCRGKTILPEMFRIEVVNCICKSRFFGTELTYLWQIGSLKPTAEDIRNVVNMAFMNYDTMRNSETQKWNTYAAMQIISDVISGYFGCIMYRARLQGEPAHKTAEKMYA